MASFFFLLGGWKRLLLDSDALFFLLFFCVCVCLVLFFFFFGKFIKKLLSNISADAWTYSKNGQKTGCCLLCFCLSLRCLQQVGF